ncbi:helix-turn-helix transcriptional regulator [Clostridium botulinum]|uniref:HTH cro/C1-type domain-containing protein n=1 Tax=Clostridium botulinum TaxID=1491 RepID=A0A126JJC9_CLOBO|nr:helix-turn-helix transcriptional regulator [Clostridium botulinum]ALT05692.1 helix-turn-helix XRE-family like hypothetical protein [Clostridium botulinum]ALT05794.1 helix-turn-helix XRE-family like hypothetical protein [Clostridium botulinum]ALT05904.1 helix-turn-helix XRE-family like hypothetical protein [Clostridium botulinum]MBN1050384.1 XRE family transcriptional regulator [Clostridium botulinum]NFI52374.1 helix-turn-helix transcriptional regulator [Clostridium botulinum]
MKIIINEQINQSKYDIPKILPNNLNLIKMNFGISTSDIANALGLNKNFVGNVVNEKANFSGLSVIKFIKHFNIPFNLIYSINKEVSLMENIHSYNICIFQIDKNYPINSEEKINGHILEMCDFLLPQNTNIIKFIKKIENNCIEYTDKDKSENYRANLIKYNEFIQNLTYDYDNYNYFCMAYEIVRDDIPVKRYIDLQKNIDIDLIRYLQSKNFLDYKFKLVTLSNKKLLYNEEDNSYILPENYSFLINNEIITSNKIEKCNCTINKNTISFTAVVEKINLINNLRFIREYKNYSKEYMAEKLHLSEETYNAIEKGYQKMSAQTMWKIELEFGVLLDSVINIEEYYKKYCID